VELYQKYSTILYKYIKNIKIFNVFQLLFFIYIFIIPFQHTAAIRNISLYLSMSIFLYLFIVKEIRINYKNIIFILFGLFFINSILSILINQIDIAGSIKELRTNLFEQFYILVVVLSVFNTKEKITQLLKILIFSYIIITCGALYEVVLNYINNELNIILNTSNRDSFNFFNSFARLSVVYLPILFGYFLLNINVFLFKEKIFFSFIFLISFFLMILYQSESITIFLIVALFISLLFKFKSKLKFIFFIFSLLILYIIIINKMMIYSKITKELLSINHYNLDNPYALSGRVGLWKGTLITLDNKKHILFGYGYGWKKLALVAGKDKYKDIYKKTNNKIAYDYFNINMYGKNNPHNGYLEVLFTTGAINLVIFILIIVLSIYFCFKTNNEISKYILLPVLISYMLNNLTNGYWEGGFGKIIMIIFAVSYLLYKESNEKTNLPSS